MNRIDILLNHLIFFRTSKSKLCKDGKSTEPITKSSDWIEASLEVPDKEVSMSFENSKLQPIFNDSEAGTPVPPPRKQKRGIKEKIEAAAKSGLLALQPKRPVEEPLCIKKKINYSCPCHDPKHKHNLEKHAVEEQNIVNKTDLKLEKSKKTDKEKESKRKKNLSVVSLPNYSDLKFTIANFGDIDVKSNDEKQITASNMSLPQGPKVSAAKSYMVRCRSFGSLLPQQLLERLKPTPSVVESAESAESDDSFGALEDWDLNLIEHYNPRDASLPRPKRPVPKTRKNNISDIENQIMTDDIGTSPELPKISSHTNSTETLLLSDNSSTSKLLDSGIINFSLAPNSLSSLEIYDSIEHYEKEKVRIFDTETSKVNIQEKNTLENNILAAPELEIKTLKNVVQQFLESEKMERINS